MAFIVFLPFLHVCKMAAAAPTITIVLKAKRERETERRKRNVSVRYICFLLMKKQNVSEKPHSSIPLVFTGQNWVI